MLFQQVLRRSLSSAAASRQSLKIGLLPADGIGREVIPAAQAAIEALGSDIPKPEFVDLLAGYELFTRTGTALPNETVEYVVSFLLVIYHLLNVDFQSIARV
jgi:homoisocitrate dehydrogenase